GSFANLKHVDEETSAPEPTPLDLENFDLDFLPAEEPAAEVAAEPSFVAPAPQPVAAEPDLDLVPLELEPAAETPTPTEQTAEPAPDFDLLGSEETPAAAAEIANFASVE